jgi:hypothetical protein
LPIGSARNGSFYDGQLDDVPLFNYALSLAQIKVLYKPERGSAVAPVTGTP